MLLTKSHKWNGKYVIPGGHIELASQQSKPHTVKSGRKRASRFATLNTLCWQEFIYDEQFWKPRHFIFLNFTARTDQGNVVLNDEAEEFIWIDPQKALKELDIDSYTVFSISTIS